MLNGKSSGGGNVPTHKSLLDNLVHPLGLSVGATLLPVRQGDVNTVYKLSDGTHCFAVKVMGQSDVTGVDHEVQFALQKRLADKKLAPIPLWLSPDKSIWVEQWISTRRDKSEPDLVYLLAQALHHIHRSSIKAPALNLGQRWRRHIQCAKPSLPSHITSKAEALIELHNLDSHDDPSWVLCHNDLSVPHILDAKTPVITDWEYAASGNRYFDVVSCAKINGLSPSAQHKLFTHYASLAELSKSEVLKGCEEQEPVVELTAALWQAAVDCHSG